MKNGVETMSGEHHRHSQSSKNLIIPSPYSDNISQFNNEDAYPDVKFIINLPSSHQSPTPLRLHRMFLSACDTLKGAFNSVASKFVSYDKSECTWIYGELPPEDETRYCEVLVQFLRFCYGESMNLTPSQCPYAYVIATQLQLKDGDGVKRKTVHHMSEVASENIEHAVEMLKVCVADRDPRLEEDVKALARSVFKHDNLVHHSDVVVNHGLLQLPQEFLDFVEYGEGEWSEFSLRRKYIESQASLTESEKQSFLRMSWKRAPKTEELTQMVADGAIDMEGVLMLYKMLEEERDAAVRRGGKGELPEFDKTSESEVIAMSDDESTFRTDPMEPTVMMKKYDPRVRRVGQKRPAPDSIGDTVHSSDVCIIDDDPSIGDELFRAGNSFFYGDGVEKDEKQAIRLFELAVEKGNAKALNRLALCYMNGDGIPQDKVKAIKLLERGTSRGSVEAMCSLALCYMNGDGIPKDKKKAIELFQLSAKQDDAKAMYHLGLCFKNGDGIPQDHKAAFGLFERGSQLADVNALFNLGLCYMNGEGVDEDKKRGTDLYAAAGEMACADAIYRLGLCYMYGEGVAKDKNKAIQLYERAADLENTNAMLVLGSFYDKGEIVTPDKEKAFNLYQRAIDILDLNYGNETDPDRLYDLNDKDKVFVSERLFDAGCDYYYGEGVADGKADKLRGINLWKHAANLGNSNAMFRVAECYEKGNVISRDMEKAVALYERASQQGNTVAMNRLALCYENGEGISKDYEKARGLLKRSSDLGNCNGAFHLAKYYWYGHGVDEDRNIGLYYFKRAAELGNDYCRELLKQTVE